MTSHMMLVNVFVSALAQLLIPNAALFRFKFCSGFRPCLQEYLTMLNFCQNFCKTTPFPGGHSFLNVALMTAVASSGKLNLLRQCLIVLPVSSVVSLFFMFFQALQSPLFQPLPSLNLRLPCLTRVLALSLFYHPNYSPFWLIMRIDILNSLIGREHLLIPTCF